MEPVPSHALTELLLDGVGDPRSPTPMDGMRGTNFIAGRRWLRERGLEAPYLERLPGEVREVIVAIDAMAWAPMTIALPHYAALDALELSYEQRLQLGADVSTQINGVVLSTIARLAGRVGLSPLTPLSRAAKLFARNFRGGAVAVYQITTSEARFEVKGAPMATSASHRDNLCGALIEGSRPFAPRVQVQEIVSMRSATAYAFQLRW